MCARYSNVESLFQGSTCSQDIKIHSTFSKAMKVATVGPVNKDNQHVKYVPYSDDIPTIKKGNNSIGRIVVDSSLNCKTQCYLGLLLNTTGKLRWKVSRRSTRLTKRCSFSVGSQWLMTMSLPSHTRDLDSDLMNTRYALYLNSTKGNGSNVSNGPWGNVTILLDTSEVRGHKFHVNILPSWPSLLASGGISRNKSLLNFPLTQVGNTTYKKFRMYNPSSSPLFIHLTMDWSYPQGMRLYESLPDKCVIATTYSSFSFFIFIASSLFARFIFLSSHHHFGFSPYYLSFNMLSIHNAYVEIVFSFLAKLH